jgi:hypothetical protein
MEVTSFRQVNPGGEKILALRTSISRDAAKAQMSAVLQLRAKSKAALPP